MSLQGPSQGQPQPVIPAPQVNAQIPALLGQPRGVVGQQQALVVPPQPAPALPIVSFTDFSYS